MKKYIKYSLPLLFVTGLLLTGCAGEEEREDPVTEPENVVPAQILAPLSEAQYVAGDDVVVEIKVNDPGISDVELYISDTLYAGNLARQSQTVKIPTGDRTKMGWTTVQLMYKDKDGNSHVDNRSIVFFSDKIPAQKKATIIETYDHARSSYTQGLEFYKGHLFEGTGRYNESILAEVDLTTGTKIRELALDGSVFGEGITILNDTIYQITYRSEVCFVYDLNFNQIKTFNYDGEGWGLANNGHDLIMSNGGAEIVWRDPSTFEIVKTIQVFDNQTSVAALNELELINGNLFVNLYTEDRIAEIDTATGKVLTYIDCRDLAVAAADNGNDVLNGIAYNPETGKTYMTGKKWPKLFEVKFE